MSDTEINFEGELFFEPELVDTGRGVTLTLAADRTKQSGGREVLKVSIRMPRESVHRLICEIRKLHDGERKHISEDIHEITKP